MLTIASSIAHMMGLHGQCFENYSETSGGFWGIGDTQKWTNG